MLFFVSRGKVLRYCCWFWLGLLDVVIYLWFLVNRGSWWDVCELIFVSPAGYVDFALSLSAGVSFQSGLLWGSMFLCTGRNFSRGYHGDFISWLWTGGFFSWYRSNFMILFFLLGKCYIICRWYSSYIKSPKMVVCLWCRIGCLLLFLFLWCYCFLVLLDVKFLVAESAFKGVNGVFQ